MAFESSVEQRRTFDPDRSLELLEDYEATGSGFSGYWPYKIVGLDKVIRFYVKSVPNFEIDDDSVNRPDKKLTFLIPYQGWNEFELEIIREAMFSHKHDWGHVPPAAFEYDVVFVGRP